MIPAKGWAVDNAHGHFRLFEFERRALRDDDLLIRIHFCGLCHSDIHEVQSDWGESMYPLIPGTRNHRTSRTDRSSTSNDFRVGDSVGVGCMVDSCRQCRACRYNLRMISHHLSVSFLSSQVKWTWNSIAFVVLLTPTIAKKQTRRLRPTEVRFSLSLSTRSVVSLE